MRTLLRALFIWLLAFTTFVMANPFWARQEGAPDESSPSTSAATATPPAALETTAAPETSAAPETTAAPQNTAAPDNTGSTTTTAPEATTTDANPTAAAGNGTTDGSSTAISSSPAATSSSPFLPTIPENLRCRKDRNGAPVEDVANPFCEPEPGQQLRVGQTYNITWDPTLFKPNSTTTVSFKYSNATNDKDTWQQNRLLNEQGFTPLTIYPSYLENRPNNTNITLFLASGDDQIKIGPVFALITAPSNATSDDEGDDDKDLGQKAGIPVGLGIFLIAVAGFVFWFLRRRRIRAAGYMAKRGGTRMTGDTESSGGAGGFKDEPTRGLELQDRAGHGRQDSWEAGWDST
ncbi:MAG: hypothetical protein Q9210_006407, partial [Variospora velana]